MISRTESRLPEEGTAVLLAQREQIDDLTSRLYAVTGHWYEEIHAGEAGSKKMAGIATK